MPLNPYIAMELKDHAMVEMLVESCYKDVKSCNKALLKINNFQKNAATNKKFSCQTRLLGLEAILIMAMNDHLKIKETQNIIQAVKKYC